MNNPMFAILVKEMLLHSEKKKTPIGETGGKLLYHLGKASGPNSNWETNSS